MSVRSGKDGQVLAGSCEVKDLTGWNLTYGNEVETFRARSGNGAEQTVAGVAAGSGDFSIVVDDTDPIAAQLTPGSLVTLELRHASGELHTGSARLGQFQWSADLSGPVQTATIPFTTHGAWTLHTASA